MADIVKSKDYVVSGKKIRAWTGGTGPALLLLHSAWGDAQMSWSSVWADLARSFTVVAPDIPGHGASDSVAGPTLSASARLLVELLDTLGIDRAVVVGNSFGVALAIELASLFPERISRFVAVNGTSVPALPGLMKGIIRIPAIEKRFRGLIRNMSWSGKAFARGFPDPAALPEGFMDRIPVFEDSHSRIGFDLVMNQAKPQSRPAVPAVVIWGTGDLLVPAGRLGSFRKWLGEHQFMPIAGAGHMPQVERPAEFAAALRRVVLPAAQSTKDQNVVSR